MSKVDIFIGFQIYAHALALALEAGDVQAATVGWDRVNMLVTLLEQVEGVTSEDWAKVGRVVDALEKLEEAVNE